MPFNNQYPNRYYTAGEYLLNAFTYSAFYTLIATGMASSNLRPIHADIMLPTTGGCPNNEPSVAKEHFVYAPISSDYPEIMAQNITTIAKFCTWKKLGMNSGRICCWNNEWHYMKYENPEMDRLLELYNIMLVRDTIGALVPHANYVFNDNVRLALATTAIPNFQMAESMLPPGFDKNHFSEQTQDEFRSNIVSRITESGIAQMYVVSSFIGDITTENWGFANGKVAFVDVDGGKNKNSGARLQPVTIADYLRVTRSALVHDYSRIALSINNLLAMKTSYAKIINSTLPRLHPSVDLDSALIKELVGKYMSIFTSAINEIQRTYPNANPALPDFNYNNILGGYFTTEMKLLNPKPARNASVKIEEIKPETPAEPAPAIQNSTQGMLSAFGKQLTNISHAVNETLNNTVTPQALTAAVTSVIASQTLKDLISHAQSAQITNTEKREIDYPQVDNSHPAGALDSLGGMLTQHPSLLMPAIATGLTFAVLGFMALRKTFNKAKSYANSRYSLHSHPKKNDDGNITLQFINIVDHKKPATVILKKR